MRASKARPLAAGLTVDARWAPTTDPELRAARWFRSAGADYGYKGYGLAMMIDLLCGALNGMAFGPRLHPHVRGPGPRRRTSATSCLRSIRTASRAAPTLEATVRAMADDVVRAGDAVQVPGDPELRADGERRARGIPIEPQALADMREWSARLGVRFRSAA